MHMSGINHKEKQGQYNSNGVQHRGRLKMCRLHLLVPVTSYWFHAQRSTGQTLVFSLALSSIHFLVFHLAFFMFLLLVFSCFPQIRKLLILLPLSHSVRLFWLELVFLIVYFLSPPDFPLSFYHLFFLFTDFHVSLFYPVSYTIVIYLFHFVSFFMFLYFLVYCFPLFVSHNCYETTLCV